MEQMSLFDMMTARWASFASPEGQSRIILEPILEETSDDEESRELWSISQYETSWSSSSDTGSVIKLDIVNPDTDSISERDFLCPPKRRKREWNEASIESTPKRNDKNIPKIRIDAILDEPDFYRRRQRIEETGQEYNSDSESSLSRTSSLIQFESLEKQLQNDNHLFSSSPLLFAYDHATDNLPQSNKLNGGTIDLEKLNLNSDNLFYDSDNNFKVLSPNFTFYNQYLTGGGGGGGNDTDDSLNDQLNGNGSDDSIKKCSCVKNSYNNNNRTDNNILFEESATRQKSKNSLENLSEDSGYCEHSIQLRQKTNLAHTDTGASATQLLLLKNLQRPTSDPTNGGGGYQTTNVRNKNSAVCNFLTVSEYGECTGNDGNRMFYKILCDGDAEDEIDGNEYINKNLKISTICSTSSKSERADVKNNGKKNKNLLKTLSRSLPNIFYQSFSDGENATNLTSSSDYNGKSNSDSSSSRYSIASKSTINRSSLISDFLRVTSYPEGLNLNNYDSGDSFENFDFYGGENIIRCGGSSIANKNLDLNDFGGNNKRSFPASSFIAAPKPVNVTASCNNLTALDYSDNTYYGNKIIMSDFPSNRRKSSNNQQQTPRPHIMNPEITLLDEISYNFDRNLSIMNDKEDNYDPLPDEPVVGVLSIKPPQPPPRKTPYKSKVISTVHQMPEITTSPSKENLTFDRDPTNLVTCYTASLERCNFQLEDSLSKIPQQRHDQEDDVEFPAYNYTITTTQSRGLVLSTPNLSSFQCNRNSFDGGDLQQHNKSLRHIKDDVSEKHYTTGILNTTPSKGSLFKEVSFHPIVSEISWKQQSERDADDNESYEEDENIHDHDRDRDRDDDDDDADADDEQQQSPSPIVDDNDYDASSKFQRTLYEMTPAVTPPTITGNTIAQKTNLLLENERERSVSERTQRYDDDHHQQSHDRCVNVLFTERDNESADTTNKTQASSINKNSTNSSNNSRTMIVKEEVPVMGQNLKTNVMEVSKIEPKQSIGVKSAVMSNEISGKNSSTKPEKKRKNGFFSRLSNFRFSLRNKSKNNSQKVNNNQNTITVTALPEVSENIKKKSYEINPAQSNKDFIYIPLKEPPSSASDHDIRAANATSRDNNPIVNKNQQQTGCHVQINNNNNINIGNGTNIDHQRNYNENNVVCSKPPLPKQPPRVVAVCAKRNDGGAHTQRASSTPREIDDGGRRRYLDVSNGSQKQFRPDTTMMISDNKIGLIETNLDTHETVITGKTRSLMELGTQMGRQNVLTSEINHIIPAEPKRPHKSMEFLLDKENQLYTLPPENELQKTHDTPLSEHQLRVQASLQRLNIPDWFRQYNTTKQQPERSASATHYKKRNSDLGKWAGLNSKTTSLSSLGSQRLDKNALLLSPSSHSHHGNTGFSRWSTSHLNSTQTSPSISGRSSFSRGTVNSNYMSGHSFINPNVGTNIRSSFRQPYLGWRSQEKLSQPRTPAERLASSLLTNQKTRQKSETENSEIQSSIKEVTSAIVHYVNDQNSRNSRSRSTSPNIRKCWLESSFVGAGPLESPQTPIIDNSFSQQNSSSSSANYPMSSRTNGVESQIPILSLPNDRHSSGSATLEDVLASLLGLPSDTNRSSGDIANDNKNETDKLSVESVPARRRSEGDAQKRNIDSHQRRVSLDSSDAKSTELLKCRYPKCEATATPTEAKKFYKSCHNCSHLYCSRECRRAHWERHRKACLHSRVSALCRQVLSACKDEPDSLRNLSLLAKRGYLSQGRGVVRILFRSPESAEMFIKQGFQSLGEASYVRWPDLMPAEMGPELYSELLRLSTEYKPDTKMLIYVAICVVSEAPGNATAPVKWERQLVSRCAKLKLCKSVLSDLANVKPNYKQEDNIDILILTFSGIKKAAQNREHILHNIQGILKQRGVNLRKNFPDVFQRLNSFADGSTDRFLPVTLHPKDSTTGRTFVCIIMPNNGEPDKLKMPNSDNGSSVQVVNVSLENLEIRN